MTNFESSQELIHALASINNRADFVRFCGQLAGEYETNKKNWGSDTPAQYLDAISRFVAAAESVQERAPNFILEPLTWQSLAKILLAASTYD